MIGIEFVTDRESKIPATQLRDQIVENAFRRGLLLLGCGESTIRLAPPLMVTKEHIDHAIEILDESIIVSQGEKLEIAA